MKHNLELTMMPTTSRHESLLTTSGFKKEESTIAIREIITGEESPEKKVEPSPAITPVIRAQQKAKYVTPKTQIKKMSMLPRIQRLGDHTPTIKITKKKINESSAAQLNVACSTSSLTPVLPQPATLDRHA